MAVKMLIVDDEPDLESLITQKFRKEIRRNEYEFVFASNGAEALEKLITHPGIELVLTDINMPRMDGLTLLDELRGLELPVLKAVIVSAYGDLDNIRTAMNRGAFDFLTKPIDLQDLEATVKKALHELTQIRKAFEVQAQLQAMEHELTMARRIQQGIVPSAFPAFPGRTDFDIYGQMTAAKQVGGDLFDYFLLSDNRLAFVIADVSGKGMPAAIFMAVSRGLLRAVAPRSESAGHCLEQVNAMLAAANAPNMFVTVFFGILDTGTGAVEYSNGGHNPPYVVHADGSLTEVQGACGIVLGIFPASRYETRTIQLQKGESLMTFTDGVTEAMDIKEEFYGEEKLCALLKTLAGRTPKEMAEAVATSVNEFAEGAPQADDITVMALRFGSQ